MQESHSGRKNRDWRDDGLCIGANLGGANHELNLLELNVANVIENVNLGLIASLREGELCPNIIDNTKKPMSGEIDGTAEKLVMEVFERESTQQVSNSLLVDNGPHIGDTQQAHILQNSVHNDKGKDMGSFFIFFLKSKERKNLCED
ncbi:hypothetical protein SLE2022_210970 [Rubroshorea leprosula]